MPFFQEIMYEDTISMRITKRYIHLNSKYRDLTSENPWNFLYTLPFFIENVVVMIKLGITIGRLTPQNCI